MDKSILVVDDSENSRNELKAAFTSIGLRVIGEAKDGIEALKLYKDLKPDVISLDLIMPHMHGIECARAIVQENPNQPILFVTSLARDIIRDHSFGDEFDVETFIQKPATPSELKPALIHILEN